MDVKVLILAILSFIAGIVFMIAGFYFRGGKFLKLLNDALPQPDEELMKKNAKKVNDCGYISFGIGGLTLVWGVLLLIFAPYAAVLGLSYLVILGICLAVLLIRLK